jgi:agmatine/peptidylarginine deiminase
MAVLNKKTTANNFLNIEIGFNAWGSAYQKNYPAQISYKLAQIQLKMLDYF